MPLSLQEVHGENVDPDVLKLTTDDLKAMVERGGKDRTFALLELGRRKLNRYEKGQRDKS